MKKITMRDVATSFTATMFLVIAISGIMMYFHFMDRAVKELHEVIGLAFVVAALLHIYVNWAAMKRYFSKKVFIAAVVIVGLISAGYISVGLSEGESPKKLIVAKVLEAPLAESFALFGGYAQAETKLQKHGIKLADAKSIKELAKANNSSPYELVKLLME